MAVDDKLIALRLTAKDRMIIQNKALAIFAGLPQEKQSSSQSADSTSHDNAVIDFASINSGGRKRLKFAIADSVTGLHNFVSVAIGSTVVANSSVARPIFF